MAGDQSQSCTPMRVPKTRKLHSAIFVLIYDNLRTAYSSFIAARNFLQRSEVKAAVHILENDRDVNAAIASKQSVLEIANSLKRYFNSPLYRTTSDRDCLSRKLPVRPRIRRIQAASSTLFVEPVVAFNKPTWSFHGIPTELKVPVTFEIAAYRKELIQAASGDKMFHPRNTFDRPLTSFYKAVLSGKEESFHNGLTLSVSLYQAIEHALNLVDLSPDIRPPAYPISNENMEKQRARIVKKLEEFPELRQLPKDEFLKRCGVRGNRQAHGIIYDELVAMGEITPPLEKLRRRRQKG